MQKFQKQLIALLGLPWALFTLSIQSINSKLLWNPRRFAALRGNGRFGVRALKARRFDFGSFWRMLICDMCCAYTLIVKPNVMREESTPEGRTAVTSKSHGG